MSMLSLTLSDKAYTLIVYLLSFPLQLAAILHKKEILLKCHPDPDSNCVSTRERMVSAINRVSNLVNLTFSLFVLHDITELAIMRPYKLHRMVR